MIPVTKHVVVVITVLCSLLFAACGDREPARPDLLRIGVLPDAGTETLKARYAPLIEYLRVKTGYATELVIPASYEDLLTLFRNKAADIAFLGGYMYVLAHDRDHAVPLAMRDIDLQLTSLFLVRKDNPAANLEDLKGKRFTFGSRLSTSGHLMPRYFLREHDIVPEKFFSQTLYSGAHDTSAYWVRNGKVDATVVNSVIIRKMFADGRLNDNDVRILWESPPFPDYVWAVQESMDPRLQQQILDSLLSLSVEIPAERAILAAVDAKRKFLPALDQDFNMAREAIKLLAITETTNAAP